MRSASFVSIVALLSVTGSLAMPASEIATSNPLADFPRLTGFAGRPGFAFADPDGVYRAYLADGCVVDAQRLTPEQIQSWVTARQPRLTEDQGSQERAAYANADSQAVPEAQLLSPPEDIKPQSLLAMMAGYVDSGTQSVARSPLEKRQLDCPSFYCTSNPNICTMYGCYCNGVICVLG